MSAVLMAGERKPMSKGWALSTPEEKAQAFATSFAYAGSFSIKGDRVIHHVQACTVQNIVGTDYIRRITDVSGDRLTLRTLDPVPWADGVVYTYLELVWERVK